MGYISAQIIGKKVKSRLVQLQRCTGQQQVFLLWILLLLKMFQDILWCAFWQKSTKGTDGVLERATVPCVLLCFVTNRSGYICAEAFVSVVYLRPSIKARISLSIIIFPRENSVLAAFRHHSEKVYYKEEQVDMHHTRHWSHWNTVLLFFSSISIGWRAFCVWISGHRCCEQVGAKSNFHKSFLD